MKSSQWNLPLLLLAILLFLLLGEESNSFQTISYYNRGHLAYLQTQRITPSSSLWYHKAGHLNDDEKSSVNEQNRMHMVRKLQQLYYQNETSGVDQDHFGIYQNMPILRSTRVELPGFQSLWNITDPLEIHMFLKVCRDTKVSRKKPHLFGHLHMTDEYTSPELRDFTSLASTSMVENEDMSAEDAYRMQMEKQQEYDFYSRDRYKVGTLMQVSDVHQDLKTGHLLVLVQALARFVVVEGSMERWDWLSLDHYHQYTKEEIVLRSHGYKPTVQRASVELLPDDEFVQYFTQKAKETADSYDFSLNQDVQGAACAGALAEAQEWRFFETQPQRIPMPGHFLDPVASLSPRLNTRDPANDFSKRVQTTMEEYLSQSPMEMHHGECSLFDAPDDVDMEDTHGTFLHGEGTAATSDETKSLAAQQHVLEVERKVWLEMDKLCKNLRHLNPRGNTQMPIPTQVLSLIPPGNLWPEDFGLALYVRQLVRAHGVLARNKYKFSNGFQVVPKDYPPLRRARRLSYILWNVFLEQDTMDVPSGEMQRVLEIHSIASRLESGLLQLQTINRILQTLIGN
jgi:hypothetical protein